MASKSRTRASKIFFCKNNCLLSVKIPRYSLNCVPPCQVIRGGILMKISRGCSQYTTSQWSNPLSFITCFNNNSYSPAQLKLNNQNPSCSFSSSCSLFKVRPRCQSDSGLFQPQDFFELFPVRNK